MCPAGMSGYGNLTNPCMIDNCLELQNMSYNLTLNYALDKDIDCSATVIWNGGQGFNPIGCNNGIYFSGNFDGKGHSINSLYIDRTGSSCSIGLFGETHGSTIANIGLKNVNIKGNRYTAALVGSANVNTKIENSTASGQVSGACTSHPCLGGGIIGRLLNGGYINNSYANVNVSIPQSTIGVGGLVGISEGQSITNSYATGNVNGNAYVGGLVGYAIGGAIITNSYATGRITGVGNVGGLIGQSDGSVVNSYWLDNLGDNAGSCCGAGTCTGCTKQTSELYFFNTQNPPMDQWDFTKVWDNICSGNSYPPLKWQNFGVETCLMQRGMIAHWPDRKSVV